MEKEIKLTISYSQYTNDKKEIEEKVLEAVMEFMKSISNYHSAEIIIKKKEV